jgi:aspartyl/glutamyl-tRNA(Asn/Gln) amidotransferase C subunit
MDSALFQHLCVLSKLGAEPEESKFVIDQMSQIVNLMDSIKTVITSPVPPSNGVGLYDLREDVSVKSLRVEEALQNVSNSQNNCFTVPKIME